MANKNKNDSISINTNFFVDCITKKDDTVEKINTAAAQRKRVEDNLVWTTTRSSFDMNSAWGMMEEAFAKQLDLDKKKEEERRKAEEERRKAEEEWIWVSGYKGTNSDMTCRDYQFEIGKKFDMPDDADVLVCHSGFHLCKNLKDVFDYYKIGEGHRFFEVSALVRKSEYENYGSNKYSSPWALWSTANKLTSKSILFTRELTADEILAHVDTKGWTDDEKKLAIDKGIDAVENKRRADELAALGYSKAFAVYIVEEGTEYYKSAKAVASQKDLSMDMKVLAILKM